MAAAEGPSWTSTGVHPPGAEHEPPAASSGTELETDMDDLAFLSRCRITVVWPSRLQGPRAAGSAGRLNAV